MINFIKLFFSNRSILRIFQINEISKCYLSGNSIEFGAHEDKEKNFSFFAKGDAKYQLSNINSDNKNILNFDLTKKINIENDTYENVLIFNVLEHLSNIEIPLKEIHRILKINGNVFGSTPFLYRIHGAPDDYLRFTESYLYNQFKLLGYKDIKIKPLGYGPFLSSFSLLRGVLKYIPIFYQLMLLMVVFLDFILTKLMKKNLKNIYPIGYFFSAKK